MAAVLSPTDLLRRDKLISLDENDLDFGSLSSTDWRAKYEEVAEMLAETRAELDEFHHASKELEAELENELQRTEKAQNDLKIKVAKAESERDEWKSKFMSLQTNHNATTASLQRELDQLRREHQQLKIQFRDLEMGNDDLERNERAVSSSLADMEAKYARALEEKILLEHELLEKAGLEEESQRLRDELRDANVEISILKDQVTALSNRFAPAPTEPEPVFTSQIPSAPSDDNLFNTQPPPDLQLCDLSPSHENISALPEAPQRNIKSVTQKPNPSGTRALYSAGASPAPARSNMYSSLYHSSIPSPRTVSARPPSPRIPSTTSTIASRNKGVQMVSEMRARVKNLEQKIHTRVPRLRMTSFASRSNATAALDAAKVRAASSASSSSKSSTAKTSWDSSTRRSADSHTSYESEPEPKQRSAVGDTSGWVLIMEDSPSPPKDPNKERRRISSPSAPSAFRPTASTSYSSTKPSNSLAQSTTRRPQSRMSAGSLSSTTTSSIPTPSSRPATPTFLPLPSNSLYTHTNTGLSLKRSIGPGATPSIPQPKRSSLSASTGPSTPMERTLASMSMPYSYTPGKSSMKMNSEIPKALPQLPGLHSNVTMRPPSKVPASSSTSSLSQSRIGRPGGGASGRKSTENGTLNITTDSRSRSGSTFTSDKGGVWN